MDPMTAASLAMAVGGTVGGLLNKKKDPGAAARAQALRVLEGVNVPDVESMKVQIEQLVQQGVLTPEDAQAMLVEHNAYDDISVDPELRGAQMSALRGLQDVYEGGGLTDIDRARIQQIRDQENTYARGQERAILEDSHRRGITGSGMEVTSRLMAQQEAAGRAGRQDMDVAADAERRALEAMVQSGQMGGQIEDRAYGQQSQKAAAANAIEQFNATNQTDINKFNVASHNDAAARNLAEKQRMSDTNTTMTNANRVRNADLLQQDYQNKMEKAKASASALTGTAQAADNRQAADMSFWGGLTSLGGQLAAASMDANKKKPMMAKGGRVPCYAEGGEVEEVPGQAMVPGDSEINDTVDIKASPGELIVPRSQADGVESMLNTLPRTANKPSPEAVKMVLQALTEMGC